MAVETVSDLEEQLRSWTSDKSTRTLPPETIWDLIDEVIDDVMDEFDPWFCFGFGSVQRSSTSHFLTRSGIPPARLSGSLLNAAQVEAGSVPDNTEYLEYLPFPTGLRRPLDVYYGDLSDNAKLTYMSYDEHRYSVENDAAGFESGVAGTTPTNFALLGEAFLLYPTPPFAMTLNAYGVYRPAKISSGGDTNIFITEVPHILRWGVMDKLILYDFAEDVAANAAMMIAAKYSKAVKKLQTRSRLVAYRTHRSQMQKAGTRRR